MIRNYGKRITDLGKALLENGVHPARFIITSGREIELVGEKEEGGFPLMIPSAQDCLNGLKSEMDLVRKVWSRQHPRWFRQ